MPININTAGYQKKERVAAPLEVYASTLDTLQKKHDTAIETQNQVKSFLANKQLNEAENKWLADYTQSINNQIEAAAQEGSYATALTTAKRLAGEVTSNPGLIGRERYQAEFKKFQDEINNSKEYDGDIKAYALEQNKYNYQDQLDDNGRVVGGSQFQPNYRPVEQIDYSTIYQKALATVGVDASAGESLVWGDENGNLKSGEGNISAGDVPYLKKGGSIQQLSKDKIRAAFEAALNETPGARASLEQDYRVNAWKASKGKSNLVTKKDGTIMSQAEFEENLFEPRYAASAYKRVTSSIDTSIGFGMMERARKAEATAAAKAAKGSTPKELRLITDFYSPVGNREIEADTPSKLTSALNDANTRLGNIYAKYNISRDLPADKAYAELRKAINQNVSITDNLRNQELREAETIWNDIQTNTNRLEAVNNNLLPDERIASEFLGRRLSSGNMADSDNPLQQRYANIMNSKFTNPDGTENDRVIVSMNPSLIMKTRQELGQLGLTSKDIRIEKIDGKEHIYISKDAYTRLAPEITGILSNAEAGFTPAKIGFTKGSNTLPKTFEKANIVYRQPVGKNGSLANVYDTATRLSEGATERLAKAFPSNFAQINSFYIPQTVTVNGESMTKNLMDDYSEAALKSLSTADGGSVKILMKDEHGVLREVEDSDSRNNIINEIANRRLEKGEKAVLAGWAIDPATGDYGMTISLPYISKTSKINKGRDAGTYFIVGAPLNATINQFKDLPAIKAAKTLYSIKYNSALNNGYKLSDSEFGDGTYTAFYAKDKTTGRERYTINTGSENIEVTEQEFNDVITNNYSNNTTLAPVKSNIEKIQARNGTISNSPVEEQLAIIQPLFQKTIIDFGVSSITDLDANQRAQVFKRFSTSYRNLTGENVPTSFQQQMIQLLQ